MATMNNTKKPAPRNTKLNHEGTLVYDLTALEDLFSKVLGSFFGENTFYEKRNPADEYNNVVELIKKVPERDKEYVLKIAELGRNCNMISYPLALLTACYNDPRYKGEGFYDDLTHRNKLFGYTDRIVRRALDITEILSMQMAIHSFEKKKPEVKYNRRNRQHPLPMQMRKGLKNKLETFDTYKLSKGLATGREVSLADAIKLLRPVPANNKMAITYKDIIEGTLTTGAGKTQIKSAVSQKGQSESKSNKDLRQAVFNGTVQNILYSLNTLAKEGLINDMDIVSHIEKLFRDPKAIRSSKLLPFRFLTAYKEVQDGMGYGRAKNDIMEAISDALDLSINNLEDIEGLSAILVDVSGSMGHRISEKSSTRAVEVALTLGAIAYKKGNSDLYVFGTDCVKIDHMPKKTPIIQMINTMISYGNRMGGSTDLFKALNYITNEAIQNKLSYDNLILLSDGDCYGYNSSSDTFALSSWGWGGRGDNPESQLNSMMSCGVVNKFWLNNLVGNSFALVNMNNHRKNLVTGFTEKIVTMINTYNKMGGAKDIRKLIDSMLEQTRPAQ